MLFVFDLWGPWRSCPAQRNPHHGRRHGLRSPVLQRKRILQVAQPGQVGGGRLALHQLLFQPDLHTFAGQDHDRTIQRPKLREIRHAGSWTDHLCSSTQGSRLRNCDRRQVAIGQGKGRSSTLWFEKSCLWQHTRSGRSKEDGKTIDRRFVNPLLEFNGKEKDYTGGEYGPQVCTDFICDFIDKNKKKPFLVYYPMILTHCPFDPTPDSTDWDSKRLGSTTYKGDRNDPQRHFRDMVAYADKAVGQIVAQLEKSGVRDNTLVIFTGDNGTDKPIVTPWNGTKVVGGKGSMTDTGTRVPLIVSWPDGIKKPGRIVDDLVEFTDMLPTLCEVSGAKLPKNHPTDGASIIPVLQNKADARTKDWIYIWYRGRVMVRNKEYSLVAKTDGSGATLTRYKGPFDGKQLDGSGPDEGREHHQGTVRGQDRRAGQDPPLGRQQASASQTGKASEETQEKGQAIAAC